MTHRVEKIVSGGQTGVDRAGLDVALDLGLAIGGWIPRGRRAEDGAIPVRYAGLVETDSDDYALRTDWNIRDSDATVLFVRGRPTGGCALTATRARARGKPLLVLDLEEKSPSEATRMLRAWLDREQPRVLNVAGPRRSSQPRIALEAAAVLRGALEPRT